MKNKSDLILLKKINFRVYFHYLESGLLAVIEIQERTDLIFITNKKRICKGLPRGSFVVIDFINFSTYDLNFNYFSLNILVHIFLFFAILPLIWRK